MNYLDNYINNQNLSKEELEHMYMYPLRLCAYNIKNIDNYEKYMEEFLFCKKQKGVGLLKMFFILLIVQI